MSPVSQADGHDKPRPISELVPRLAAVVENVWVGGEDPVRDPVLAHVLRLLQAGFTVRLISSLALARTREALHNGWDKNDPKDAQVTLHMLRIGATQHYHDPLAAGLNDLQEVSKTHEAISRAKTEVLHRILTHHLPLYFPKIDRFRHNSRSDWFFAFLDRFPTPGRIAEARSLIQQRNALEAMAVELVPSWKVTPAMTFGNWFSPVRRRQVFAAAMTSLNTISRAVVGDSAPLVRTVRCRTVANTLSIGFAVRR